MKKMVGKRQWITQLKIIIDDKLYLKRIKHENCRKLDAQKTVVMYIIRPLALSVSNSAA